MDIVERAFAGFTIRSIAVSEMQNNVYLVTADGADSHVLIDAADDLPAIRSLIEAAGGGGVDAILTTHRHWDHVRALEEVLAATGAKHYAAFLESPALPAPVDVELQHDDTIEFGGRNHDVIILRGHTPGGAALAVNLDGVPQLFVGDSLFPGGVG